MGVWCDCGAQVSQASLMPQHMSGSKHLRWLRGRAQHLQIKSRLIYTYMQYASDRSNKGVEEGMREVLLYNNGRAWKNASIMHADMRSDYAQALRGAADRGDLSSCCKLVNERGADDVHARDKEGSAPIHYAAALGQKRYARPCGKILGMWVQRWMRGMIVGSCPFTLWHTLHLAAKRYARR